MTTRPERSAAASERAGNIVGLVAVAFLLLVAVVALGLVPVLL